MSSLLMSHYLGGRHGPTIAVKVLLLSKHVAANSITVRGYREVVDFVSGKLQWRHVRTDVVHGAPLSRNERLTVVGGRNENTYSHGIRLVS